ncbi:molybdenum cofactor sulfurylase [Poseidonocella pacifica]|uniref:Molybdenum cofactor sulfurylase n=1 Tax=Poseidonocella pacifica TaxID=871651 RepID=A0A1I0WAQ3_9RHOB|nr:xanthine dehydrogenase accessory protein XdhC [Poseidonocella pacifica]SFA84976.1 molybdenum cofactor sulfurylase [Poseidonocella pacifica]
MSFDLSAIRRAIAAHGPVARVVVAEVKGSAPREVGASMLVWKDGQSGTIGGGTLEHEAARNARTGRRGLSRHALGPDLGQCCGGAVTLLTEEWDADRLADIHEVAARPVDGAEMPLAVARTLDRARAQGIRPAPHLLQGWFLEPVLRPTRQLWIWGAGHVGRALVTTLSPLPDLSITWIDTAPERFPAEIPEGVTALPAAAPEQLAAHAPTDAEHLILTYSHDIDFALCDALLRRGFGAAGVIGSATKWARFRKRLHNLGHSHDEIMRIRCPIGRKDLGKHPQAIAIGVAAALLNSEKDRDSTQWDSRSSSFGA